VFSPYADAFDFIAAADAGTIVTVIVSTVQQRHLIHREILFDRWLHHVGCTVRCVEQRGDQRRFAQWDVHGRFSQGILNAHRKYVAACPMGDPGGRRAQ
jgi:hypothetical protein